MTPMTESPTTAPSPLPAASDPVEAASIAADALMIRSVRRRLVLWSGGVTLVVLLVLGSVLYAAVARSLGTTGIAVLEARATAIREAIERPGGPPLGMAFGGGSAGTFAFIVRPNDRVIGPSGLVLPEGLPDRESVAHAREDGSDMRTISIDGVPFRLLTVEVGARRDGFVVQVLADRSAEQRTLDVLAMVLIAGGLLATLVAAGFGALYARRALAPIRESLDARRVALRRQRAFAADASHELRTPLTVVRTSVEHLERHRDEPVAAVGTALDDIRAETDHLTRLVDDLLLLARTDSGTIELEHVPVDLGELVAEAAGSLGPMAAERSVRVLVESSPVVVDGDQTRLRQLLVILVDNAIAHSPAGSEVRVGVGVSADGWAQIDVDDAGPGIRDEDVPRVFERFWRAPGAPEGGTGLGLSIAAWIVGRHGGTVGVANRPEGGARFSVRLPPSTPQS
jgi:signal transduction histidine kinase